MLSCLICFKSLEFSSENVMCIPQCGHVFHGTCVNMWLEVLVIQKLQVNDFY